MRSVTIYKDIDGNIVKLPGGATRRESYDGIVGKPFHQRVIDAYYKLECDHKLSSRDFSEFGGAGRVAELHKRELQG